MSESKMFHVEQKRNRPCGMYCQGANDARPGQRSCRACHARWMREHPQVRSAESRVRALARWTAHNALRAGKLVRVPCGCGCATPLAALEMHHEDYAKPLEVVFCCPAWHDQLDHLREARLRSTIAGHGEAHSETRHARVAGVA